MTEFATRRSKKYSYLSDDDKDSKIGKDTKKCVIK